MSQVGGWDNKWSWKAEWSCSLFVWEVDEEACLLYLLKDKALSLGVMDKWVWKLGKSSVLFC